MKKLIAGALFCAFSFGLLASTASPYSGQQNRQIKALSQQQIEGYINGHGLGYAKAAELNHYPGPKHVLETAQQLSLSEQQLHQTQALFETMKIEASELGQLFIEKERQLDRGFSEGALDADSLQTLLLDIGALQARIRHVHLNAHLSQRGILTDAQVQMYDQLRGYGAGSEHSAHHESPPSGHQHGH